MWAQGKPREDAPKNGRHPIQNVLTGRKQVTARENITTKGRKNTMGNQIENNFVIFVYFEVDKFYSVLQYPNLPLRSWS